jgi:AraC family L-rhamnose operon regulatory protein RhaS
MIREIGRSRHAAGGTLAAHRNAGIEICFIRRGEYRWQVEGRDYRLEPGDGFMTLPWQIHGNSPGSTMRGSLDFVVIGLEACTAKGAWRWGDWCRLGEPARRFVARSLLVAPGSLLPGARVLGPIFDRLWSELRGQPVGHLDLIHACLDELLLQAARLAAHPVQEQRDDPAVHGALAQIAARIDEPWSLADMAACAGLGRSRFSERVQAISGLSPKRWLESQRLAEARRRLRETSASVTAIAIDLGFSSSQYFATCFRRDSGLSPSQWREGPPDTAGRQPGRRG